MSLLIYSYFLKYKTTVEEIVSVISSDLSFKDSEKYSPLWRVT